jgi:hypothetical protein
VGARLSLADDPSRVFAATLPTVNISVGGLFLESSFFLKLGTRLAVELSLPPWGRVVNVKAEVVRVDSADGGPSGFALRFTEYLDGSEVVLATHFLSPVLKEFLTAYAKQHHFEASADYLAHTADVLAAWELKKAELGGDVGGRGDDAVGATRRRCTGRCSSPRGRCRLGLGGSLHESEQRVEVSG